MNEFPSAPEHAKAAGLVSPSRSFADEKLLLVGFGGSGVRMSGMWPSSWKAVPVSWARAVHFATMIYFVAFVAIHVFLVLATGARGNLNAMFAAREDATSWLGVVLFLIALAVTALGWWAARASVVAPLANATGKVSKR